MAAPSSLVIGVAGVGLVFVWSAIHGANVTSSLKDLLSGHTPGTPSTDPLLLQVDVGAIGAAAGAAAGSSTAGLVGSAGGSAIGAVTGGGDPTSNKALGKVLAAAYGWSTGDEWDSLDKLWTRESGWNNTAQNPTSTAYGIAQFLDSTWAPYGPKTSDPSRQIQYGLHYIKDRYGDPVRAWEHEVNIGWY